MVKNRFFKAVVFAVMIFSSIVTAASAYGITEAKTPQGNAELQWAVKYTSDWTESITPPTVTADCIYAVKDNKVLKISKADGSLLAESEPLKGSAAFSTIAPTYGGGMIFVPIGKGRVQALDAETLEPRWVTAENESGGQTISPIVYADGCIYTGTWNGEDKDGEFFCINTADNGDVEKKRTWSIKHKGGFYWMGAYVSDNYVIFGGDDGKDGTESDSAVLYSVDKYTGEIIDKAEGLHGDLRSGITYDEATESVYFTSKGARLYKVFVNESGNFGEIKYAELNGSSTSSPIVYDGKVFVGVSAENAFDKSGHTYAMIDSGSMELSDSISLPGYPQADGLLCNAYELEDKLYIYTSYNAEPGGIYELDIEKDNNGMHFSKGIDLFIPESNMSQYCICGITADEDGVLYYKNDSGYIMAVAVGEKIKFNDIKNHWAKECICDMAEKGIINGRSDTVFAPNDNITRAEFVSILYRMSGEKAISKLTFNDISGSDWYCEAVCWAAENGIAGGMPNGEFAADMLITREQMAVMTDKYIKHMSIAVEKTNTSVSFSDFNKISDWASESVLNMLNAGIINGRADGSFAPKDNATRAEAAKMLSALV